MPRLELGSTACTATTLLRGVLCRGPLLRSSTASASYLDHALSLQSPACALDYHLLSCPEPGLPWLGGFSFPTPLPAPSPRPIDWLVRHAALTVTQDSSHVASCDLQQLASSCPFRTPSGFSEPAHRARGRVACLALPKLGHAIICSVNGPPPGGVGGFLNGLRPRCVMGSLASKHSLLTPCPWTWSPAHTAAVITRFGRRQALATKPLVPVPCP